MWEFPTQSRAGSRPGRIVFNLERGVFVRRYVKVLALVAVLGLVAAACGGDDGGDETGPTAATGDTTATGSQEFQQGGTLNLGMIGDVDAGFDPQKSYYSVTWEYYRCCLLRTLTSYLGVTTAEGGAELQPDIATELPEVSSDGLTWTFTLKSGIFYAPPFQDVEVTSADILRAIERVADPDASVGGYPFYFSPIEGFDDFSAGDADTISGIETPDDSTFVVTTTAPAGETCRTCSRWRRPLRSRRTPRMSLSALPRATRRTTAVSWWPAVRTCSSAASTIDFSLPADEQTPAAGYEPGQSIQLVRNPSYDPATDGLRPAYPDAINVTIGGDEQDLFNKVVAR